MRVSSLALALLLGASSTVSAVPANDGAARAYCDNIWSQQVDFVKRFDVPKQLESRGAPIDTANAEEADGPKPLAECAKQTKLEGAVVDAEHPSGSEYLNGLMWTLEGKGQKRTAICRRDIRTVVDTCARLKASDYGKDTDISPTVHDVWQCPGAKNTAKSFEARQPIVCIEMDYINDAWEALWKLPQEKRVEGAPTILKHFFTGMDRGVLSQPTKTVFSTSGLVQPDDIQILHWPESTLCKGPVPTVWRNGVMVWTVMAQAGFTSSSEDTEQTVVQKANQLKRDVLTGTGAYAIPQLHVVELLDFNAESTPNIGINDLAFGFGKWSKEAVGPLDQDDALAAALGIGPGHELFKQMVTILSSQPGMYMTLPRDGELVLQAERDKKGRMKLHLKGWSFTGHFLQFADSKEEADAFLKDAEEKNCGPKVKQWHRESTERAMTFFNRGLTVKESLLGQLEFTSKFVEKPTADHATIRLTFRDAADPDAKHQDTTEENKNQGTEGGPSWLSVFALLALVSMLAGAGGYYYKFVHMNKQEKSDEGYQAMGGGSIAQTGTARV